MGRSRPLYGYSIKKRRIGALIILEGMDALISKLRYVDAERFIALISHEPFDYTKWREQYLNDDINVRELSKNAMVYSKNL